MGTALIESALTFQGFLAKYVNAEKERVRPQGSSG